MPAPVLRAPRSSRPVVILAAGGVALTAQQAPRALGVDLAAFDRTVRPQDDFNRFVNGTWMKTTEIPADRSTWGSFVELADKSDAALKEIIDSVTKTPQKPGSTAQQVADLYLAFMDTARIESLGTEPLGNELKAIAALTLRRATWRVSSAAWRAWAWAGPSPPSSARIRRSPTATSCR